MEAHQDSITCSRSPNWFVVELEFEPKKCSSKTHGFDYFAILFLFNVAEETRYNFLNCTSCGNKIRDTHKTFSYLCPFPSPSIYILTPGKEGVGGDQSTWYQC